MWRASTVVIVSLLIGASGCEYIGRMAPKDATRPGVAVIDLDELASQLGRDKELAKAIKQREAELNQQLASVQTSYEEQIAEQQSLGQPSANQTDKIGAMQQEAAIRLSQVRQQAQLNLSQHRLKLIQDFRAEIQPLAQAVATEKGLSLVVTKNDAVVFWHDAVADITAEVANRLRTREVEYGAPAKLGSAAEGAQPINGSNDPSS